MKTLELNTVINVLDNDKAFLFDNAIYLDDVKTKLKWFGDYTEIFLDVLVKYFCAIPIFNDVEFTLYLDELNGKVEYKDDLDFNEALFMEFRTTFFYFLWNQILYNPKIKPSLIGEITEADLKLMNDVIEDLFSGVFAFYLMGKDKISTKELSVYDIFDALKPIDEAKPSAQLRKKYLFYLANICKFESDASENSLSYSEALWEVIKKYYDKVKEFSGEIDFTLKTKYKDDIYHKLNDHYEKFRRDGYKPKSKKNDK